LTTKTISAYILINLYSYNNQLKLFIYLENTAYMGVVFAVVVVLMISRNSLKTLACG